MEFAVGDGVMYPSRGAGRITGVEHIELVEGFEHYYVIDIPSERLIVRIPVRKVADLGLRPVMSETKLGDVLGVLRSKPDKLADDYKERQLLIDEQIKTGSAMRMAAVIRDLTWRLRVHYLTKRDGDLLNQARDLLVTEMAVATDREVSALQEEIDTALLEHVSEA
ncbi:MAG TPA: CarD family transcriptional regulator [Anaerolineae bacterium]|nr:CarD family transcriptional regulator [Anaerolineae bacterium]